MTYRVQRPCSSPHGTTARYVAGCSCFECCEAWRVYQVEWKADPDPRLIDAAPVAEYIAKLRHNGWHNRAIAEQAGVAYNTVRFAGTLRPTIHRDTAAAIMSLATVPLPTDSTALVPARPTLRLIARLRRDFSEQRIADECGVSRKSLPRHGQRSVQSRVAKRVQDAAARLRVAATQIEVTT